MRIFLTVLAIIVCQWSVVHAQWNEVRTENFIVSGSASQATMRNFAVELEQFRIVLARLGGQQPTPEPVPVEVYLMRNESDLYKIIGNGIGVVGVYRPLTEKGIFVANVSLQGERYGHPAGDVVKHEYVHHFTYRTGPFYYPIWYSEGIADFFSTFEYEDGVAQVGKLIQGRINQLFDEDWLDLKYVIGSKANWQQPGRRRLDSRTVALYYAQSWFLVHYLQSDPAYTLQVNTYLKRVREGAPLISTFEEVFEVTLDEMEARLEQVWRDKSIPLKYFDVSMLDLDSIEEPEAIRLGREETAARRALLGSYFQTGTEKGRADNINELKKALERTPEDIRLITRLATVLIGSRQYDQAQTYVSQAKAVAPEHALTYLVSGEILRQQLMSAASFEEETEIWRQIREQYSLAREADPRNARAHFLFAQSYLQGPGGATEEAVDAALDALELSPDAFDVPFTAAVLLGRTGYKEDAVFLLEGLASWASRGDLRSRAREELYRLRPDLRSRQDGTAIIIKAD